MRTIFKIIRFLFSKYFSVQGILFTIVQILEYYDIRACFINAIFMFTAPLLVTISILCIEHFRISYKIPGREHKISVTYGNILKKRNSIAIIGVNDKLETSPQNISNVSIHGQLIKKVGVEKVVKLFDEAKDNLIFDDSKNTYKYGQYFPATVKNKEIMLLVMSSLKSNRNSAVSTSKDIKESINTMFDKFKQDGGFKNQTIDCPVLGTGITDASWEYTEAIIYILKNYIMHSKDEGLGIKHFRICIPYKKMFEIMPHLRTIKKTCEQLCDLCYTCENNKEHKKKI